MPQLEDGYTRIANELLEALVSNRIAGEQMQCFLFILRKTYGFKKKVDMISLSQFVTATGMKKPAVCRALSSLENRNIIVIKKDNSNMTSYSINKTYQEWVALSKKITLSKKIISIGNNDNETLAKMIHTKDTLTKDTITKEIKKDSGKPKLTPIAIKTYSPEVMKIVSDFILKKLEDYSDHPALKNPNLDSWYDTIEKINRIDGHSFKTIREVIRFSIYDSFWCDQVISLAGLRNNGKNKCKKFDNIRVAMNKKPIKEKSTKESRSMKALEDWLNAPEKEDTPILTECEVIK